MYVVFAEGTKRTMSEIKRANSSGVCLASSTRSFPVCATTPTYITNNDIARLVRHCAVAFFFSLVYTPSDEQLHYMRTALAEAAKCEPTPTAFCVGCVLVTHWPSLHDQPPVMLATGYSRELPGNTHAEANALAKANRISPDELTNLFSGTSSVSLDKILRHTDVYTTLEPCSIRTSGLAPCADALIAAKIRQCFIGVGEPDDFVKCEGAQKLKDAGIEVVWLKGLEEECLKAARRGHDA